MSRIQKVILFFSALFFGFTLFAFLRLDMWMLLMCFTIHSILLIIFSILCFKMVETPSADMDELSERIVNIKAEWASETESYKAELEKKDSVIQANNAMLEESSKTIVSLKQQLSALQLEMSDIKEEEHEDPGISILPLLPSDSNSNSTVNIIKIAESVIDELKETASRSGIQMNVSAPNEDIMVKADPNMLRILFRNIVDNAIKYMRQRGMLVITVSSIDSDIFVVCKDTGDGLAEAETKHIFELNYQGSNRISGNGLGLYQAKAIVNYYGGTIYAKSTPGKGMGIYIQLPST